MTTAMQTRFQPRPPEVQEAPMRTEITNDTRPEQEQAPTSKTRSPLVIIVLNLSVMALVATIAATAVLTPSLILPGIFVAFLMMSFIGLPLILASVGDAADKH